MTEWALKATNDKVDHPRTAMLCHRQFFPRSRYNSGRSRIGLVGDVALGDTLHLFFPEQGKVRRLGRFEIVSPVGHPYQPAFGAKVAGTEALYIVEDPTFIYQIDKAEVFKPDPVLGKLTGWCIRRVPGAALPYRTSLFSFRQTLARVV